MQRSRSQTRACTSAAASCRSVSERNRLALELHDVVSQKLFSMMLTAETAATQLDRDPAAAKVQVERLRELAREALDELSSLILGLRPPELERDGLAGALHKEAEMLGRVHGVEIEVQAEFPTTQRDGAAAEVDLAVLRIAHEALQNSLRHARARVAVVVRRDGTPASRSPTTGSGSSPGAPSCARATSG